MSTNKENSNRIEAELERTGLASYEAIWNREKSRVRLRDLASNDWPKEKFPFVTDWIEPDLLLKALGTLDAWDEEDCTSRYVEELFEALRAIAENKGGLGHEYLDPSRCRDGDADRVSKCSPGQYAYANQVSPLSIDDALFLKERLDGWSSIWRPWQEFSRHFSLHYEDIFRWDIRFGRQHGPQQYAIAAYDYACSMLGCERSQWADDHEMPQELREYLRV